MTAAEEVVLAALARAEYRTSSYTSGNGECVMVGHAAGWVGIRDSKDARRTTIPATHHQWTALLAAAKSGHLR